MEKKINCLIVDDEPLSLEILQKYIEDIPALQLTRSCNNAFEAMEAIEEERIDLIFLDINMPKLSGIQLAKTLSYPMEIIFTTAYPEFAVEGFEMNAIDYLVKPFDFERFLKAVNKYKSITNHRYFSENSQDTEKNENVIWLKADKKLHRVEVSDIVYIEATGDYLKFVCKKTKFIVHNRMQTMEEELEKYNFCRIHRSYIIQITKIDFIEANRVGIGGVELPVGASYKEIFQKKLNALS